MCCCDHVISDTVTLFSQWTMMLYLFHEHNGFVPKMMVISCHNYATHTLCPHSDVIMSCVTQWLPSQWCDHVMCDTVTFPSQWCKHAMCDTMTFPSQWCDHAMCDTMTFPSQWYDHAMCDTMTFPLQWFGHAKCDTMTFPSQWFDHAMCDTMTFPSQWFDHAMCHTVADNSVFVVLSVVTALLGMMGATGVFGSMFFYTPEIYPTNIRSTVCVPGTAVFSRLFVCRPHINFLGWLVLIFSSGR